MGIRLRQNYRFKGKKLLARQGRYAHARQMKRAAKMTRGLKSAPLSATPREVAEVAVAGMKAGKHTVWAPPALRYVFMILRHVPRPIFRRLPMG